MIIVSQDKKAIYNFNNINYIYVNCENEIRVDNVKSNNLLGKYETEERAKEVLQEIVNKYGKYDIDDCNAVTIFPKVYEMPEE